MKIHTIQLFVACCVSSFAGVHCFNVWLGHKMVHAVCKQTVNYKGGEVPDGSKDAELHAGQKECEWISWTRCSAGTECKLSKKNHCGGENQGSTGDQGNSNNQVSTAEHGNGNNQESTVEHGNGNNQESTVEHGNGNNQWSTADQGNTTNQGSTGDQGNGDGDSEKQQGSILPFSLPTSMAAEIKLGRRLNLTLDHPNAVKGALTLWNATLGGFEQVTSSLKYDPDKMTFTGEIEFKLFRLTGTYRWNLFYFYDSMAVNFRGGGRINMMIRDLKLQEVMGEFIYSARRGTFQLRRFDSKYVVSNGWRGELDGATLEGQPATLSQFQIENGKAGNHFVQELLRQIFNHAALKNLAGRHLDIFFSAFRHGSFFQKVK